MKLLAIESSSLVASVAIIEEETLKAEYTVDFKKTHSQTLLPMIDEVFRRIEMVPEEIDAIAVSLGPGSFTGLRIGSATAKGIGFALKKPIVEVPTIDAMAYNFCGFSGVVCPIMDARRNQVYTGIYTFEKDKLVILKEQNASSIEELTKELNEMNREVVFLGDGIPRFSQYIDENLRCNYFYAPAHLSRQHAGSLGTLGMMMLKEGNTVSADEHVPDYIRLSQAERCLNEKSSNE